MDQLNILITGAGIGGLSAAAALENKGIYCRIIEKTPGLGNRGYAMTIQGEGIAALETLGLLEKIKNRSVKRIISSIITPGGKTITSIPPSSMGEGYTIPRDSLHRILKNNVRSIDFGLSVSEINRRPDGQLEVQFSDKSKEVFNYIIAAEGINSVLRQRVSNKNGVVYSGFSVWNVRIPGYFPEIIEIWSRKKIAAFYPLKEGVSVSFFKKISPAYQSPEKYRKRELLRFFGDMKVDSVRYIINTVTDNIFYSPVRSIRIPSWYKDGIILIGDAAHGVSPLTGMGANLAIADSVALAEILSEYKERTPGEMENKIKNHSTERKKEAENAYRTGSLRAERAFAQFPASLIRNHNLKKTPWEY